MAEKQKNFISAVVYLGEASQLVQPFLQVLCSRLQARFASFELVFVNDAAADDTVQQVRAFLEAQKQPIPASIIHMSLKQGRELAMNAGLDMAIGDFVYEFDTLHMPYSPDYIDKAYDACLEGNDIVTVSPAKNRKLSSTLFYSLFNKNSGSKYKLQTDVFRLLSRRAINRVHSISATVPYRKAAYAACGLKLATLVFAGSIGGESELRASRAIDSLALYTDIGYKISVGVAFFMLLLMLFAIGYTIAMYFMLGAQAISEGWTTLMLVVTGGFFGVFLILAMVLKYLSLLVALTFKNQRYLVESVEKLK